MNIKRQDTVCGDTVFEAEQESGLRVFVCPKKGYSSTYAIFGTAYGSVNNCFLFPGDPQPVEVPPGIAHFLEHKLFENEKEDAFVRYARTGASANAYTSFDKTCYLFSCSQNFEASLEILLDFVQTPYFTPETVQKEQGIIGQEIRMGLDDPERRVVWNLLAALYHSHPVRLDIAGSVESIARIDADLLYRCYRAYYRPENMALCIAGNVEPDSVFAAVDHLIRPAEVQGRPQSVFPAEPQDVVTARTEQHFPVAVPLFQLGFKERAEKRADSRRMVETEILLELLASESSSLYRSLLDRGWINPSFGCEYFEGPGYAAVLFGGESHGQAWGGCDRCRYEPQRGRKAVRRCRFCSGGAGRFLHHSGSGRCRPDDDCHADAEHPDRRQAEKRVGWLSRLPAGRTSAVPVLRLAVSDRMGAFVRCDSFGTKNRNFLKNCKESALFRRRHLTRHVPI